MKKLFVLFCALLFTGPLLADKGGIGFSATNIGTDWVECLGIEVAWSNDVIGVTHTVYDGSGGTHYIRNVRFFDEQSQVGGLMHWTGRGQATYVINTNGNNLQLHQTWQERELLRADGDYPDLLWTFEFTGTFNAKGELVASRLDFGTLTCVYR